MYQDISKLKDGESLPVSPAVEVGRLVERYPSLSETETARLINLYRQMPPLDAALMISDDRLAPKLDRFVAENRQRIGSPFRHYAALIAVAFAGAALTLWAVVA